MLADRQADTREPPRPVLATTMPGWSATQVPIRRAARPSGCDVRTDSTASADSAGTKAISCPSFATSAVAASVSYATSCRTSASEAAASNSRPMPEVGTQPKQVVN